MIKEYKNEFLLKQQKLDIINIIRHYGSKHGYNHVKDVSSDIIDSINDIKTTIYIDDDISPNSIKDKLHIMGITERVILICILMFFCTIMLSVLFKSILFSIGLGLFFSMLYLILILIKN